jgi:ribonuclease E
MVINQTEALVSVDINSGKSTREHNIEDTALRTNLEASDEIARQLRLRDLAGLVVIDFIDMEEKRNNRNVERRLKDALKNDRARIQVGHISHFGLLEMSRQRLRPGLLEGSSRTCPHCEGRGIVRSVSSCGLSVLRAIEEHLIARKPENLTVKCTREIAFYILNEKRDNLLSIETTYGISVFIVPSDELKGSQALIERAPDRNTPPRKVIAAPVRIDSAFEDEDEDDSAPEAAEAEESFEGEAESDDEDSREASGEERQQAGGDRPDGGKRRRRRRGRRGGRGRDDQPNGQQASGEDELGAPGEAEDEDREDSETPAPALLGEDAATEAGEDGPEASESGAEDTGERGRSGRPRRDRWGRNRSRGEDRGRRSGRDGAEREDVAVREDVADAAPVAEMAAPVPPPPRPAPAPAPVAEAAPAAEPPRRWQPPAPTVTPAPAERKSGWWSKKT